IARMRADARRALDQVGLGIDEWVAVAGLPVGHMQFIEIAREVDKANLRLLIFDEPTAVLTESDAEKLLEIMRGLAAKGHAILFITHRLDEVLAVADRITVLRDGEVVGTPDPKDTTVVRIAEPMVGLLPEESIQLNIALSTLVAHGRFLHPFPVQPLRLVNQRAMRAHALEMIRALDIRTTGHSQQVRRLSGGNQQKVCVARAMTL